jgi:hypothetical protein
MKHAGPDALLSLQSLLTELRARAGMIEKKPGIFYRRGKAFLHFHEDPLGLFADVSGLAGWDRYAVNTPAEQATFIRQLEDYFD